MVDSRHSQTTLETPDKNPNQEPATQLSVIWGPQERAWQQIRCSKTEEASLNFSKDIYESGASVSSSFLSLQESMGLRSPAKISRSSYTETDEATRIQPENNGTFIDGSASAHDPFDFHQSEERERQQQSAKSSPDPFDFNQGVREPLQPAHREPQSLAPGDSAVRPGQRPSSEPPEALLHNSSIKPAGDTQPHCIPYQPQEFIAQNHNQCHPCRPHWHPGMIAGRVIHRIFRGRCR